MGQMSNRTGHDDDPRRQLLVELLAAGALWALLPQRLALAQSLLGKRPGKLPPQQSVYDVRGQVSVNNQPVSENTRIALGDTLRTGRDSEIIFVVGSTAMLMRQSSELALIGTPKSAAAAAVSNLKLVGGKVLTVYAPGQHEIQTPQANMRLRGTGAYIEADAQQTYFCTCYGVAEVTAVDDPDSKELVAASYHDKPLYIVAGRAKPGKAIRRAPFINHTDQELALIEALVGRKPPFIHGSGVYQGPASPSGDYGR